MDFVISLGRWLVRQLNGSVLPQKEKRKKKKGLWPFFTDLIDCIGLAA